MRGDFLPDGLAEAVPQVPAVADLHRVRQCLADGLAVGARPVPAHDLDSRVVPQPLLRDISGAALDDIDAPAGLGVDEDGRVDQAASQREVVNPEHAGYFEVRKADRQQDPQRGVPGDVDSQRRQQPRSRAAC